MVSIESDLRRSEDFVRLGEGETSRFQAERAYLVTIGKEYPWYAGDLTRLLGEDTVRQSVSFFADSERSLSDANVPSAVSRFTAGLRVLRPYDLPDLPEGEFLGVDDSYNIRSYFVGAVSPRILRRTASHHAHLSSFQNNQETLFFIYKNKEFRPFLDTLSLIAPNVLRVLEYHFFQDRTLSDIAQLVQTNAVRDQRLGVRALGMIDRIKTQSHEERYQHWLGPVMRRFQEIQIMITGLPANLQEVGWRLARGEEATKVAIESNQSYPQVNLFRDEQFRGRQSLSLPAFKDERRRESVLQLRRIPFARQAITVLTQQFLKEKIAGKTNEKIGEEMELDNHGVAILANRLLSNLSLPFVKSTTTGYWEEIQRLHEALIQEATEKGKALTEPDEDLLRQSIDSTSDRDYQLINLFLGGIKPRIERAEARQRLIGEFIEAGGLATEDRQTQEIIEMLNNGMSPADIRRAYPSLPQSRLVFIQKKMELFVDEAKYVQFLAEIKNRRVDEVMDVPDEPEDSNELQIQENLPFMEKYQNGLLYRELYPIWLMHYFVENKKDFYSVVDVARATGRKKLNKVFTRNVLFLAKNEYNLDVSKKPWRFSREVFLGLCMRMGYINPARAEGARKNRPQLPVRNKRLGVLDQQGISRSEQAIFEEKKPTSLDPSGQKEHEEGVEIVVGPVGSELQVTPEQIQARWGPTERFFIANVLRSPGGRVTYKNRVGREITAEQLEALEKLIEVVKGDVVLPETWDDLALQIGVDFVFFRQHGDSLLQAMDKDSGFRTVLEPFLRLEGIPAEDLFLEMVSNMRSIIASSPTHNIDQLPNREEAPQPPALFDDYDTWSFGELLKYLTREQVLERYGLVIPDGEKRKIQGIINTLYERLGKRRDDLDWKKRARSVITKLYAFAGLNKQERRSFIRKHSHYTRDLLSKFEEIHTDTLSLMLDEVREILV